jgi:hypothetical protein
MPDAGSHRCEAPPSGRPGAVAGRTAGRKELDAPAGARDTAPVTRPEDDGDPVWRFLEVPRVPGEVERRLLAVLTAAVDEPLLDEQVATVVVDAVCRCGCSSVRLRTDARAIPVERLRELSATGRDDHVEAAATGVGATEHVDVVLHVLAGRVRELEVFDREGGEGVAVELGTVTELTEVTVA